MSNCKELWIARRKQQHLQTAGKDHQLRKRDGVPQKESEREREKGERQIDRRERMREGGPGALLYEKRSLIHVENVELLAKGIAICIDEHH